MGWFSNLFSEASSRAMRDEMMFFRDSLAGMSGEELGFLLAMANHLRIQYEAIGHRPLDALTYADENPEYLHQLFATVKKNQQTNSAGLQVAAANMVWLHTARAGKYIELRYLGQAIWKELSRGFPHIQTAAAITLQTNGLALNTFEATKIPIAMESNT
jgi:hypothetical protein